MKIIQSMDTTDIAETSQTDGRTDRRTDGHTHPHTHDNVTLPAPPNDRWQRPSLVNVDLNYSCLPCNNLMHRRSQELDANGHMRSGSGEGRKNFCRFFLHKKEVFDAFVSLF